jgi:hypothetical protein
MPYEIRMKHLPAGFAAETIRPGEGGFVCTRGLFTPDRDASLYRMLDSFAQQFLGPYFADGPHLAAQVDTVLVVVARDGLAKVYVNDVGISALARAKRPVKKGEGIRYDDIADVIDIKLTHSAEGPLDLANDKAIYFLFRAGWRQAFYFDLEPIAGKDRDVPIGRSLAKCWTILSYDEVFGLTEEHYQRLYEIGWFPFIAILGAPFKQISEALTLAGDPKSAIDNMIQALDRTFFEGILVRARASEYMSSQVQLVEKGIERYLSADYISCISIVWPRIEGVIRQLWPQGERPIRHRDMPDCVEGYVAKSKPFTTLSLHDRFAEYLRRVYLKNFDHEATQNPVSRHSVAHGVASYEDFTCEKALIGLLILDQLGWYTSQ